MFEENKGPIDIFASVDDAPPTPVAPPPGLPVASQPGAIPPGLPPGLENAKRKGPSAILFVLFAIVLLGGIALGVWFFFLKGNDAGSDNEVPAIEKMELDTPVGIDPEPVQTGPTCGDALCEVGENAENCAADCAPVSACGDGSCDGLENEISCPADCSIPEPILPVVEEPEIDLPPDADNDGLSDAQELELGTNPQDSDTDSDGLSDREEVQIYSTDPNNPDSDGDTYLDGEEVRNGYDPNGSGRLFNVPGA